MPEVTFTLPDLGEGLEEAEISAWRVAEGDAVELNQVIVDVNTEKALVEIPSPYAGTVVKLHAAEGDTVKVGGALVTFEVRQAVLVGYGVGGTETQDRKRPRLRPPPERAAGERIAVRGVRRLIARRMTESWTSIPHVTTFITVDCSELETFREHAGVGVLPVVVRALAEVVRSRRTLNASFDARRGEIVLHDACHTGIATDTPEGLLVPVVRDAGSKGLLTLGGEIASLVEAARAGKATREQLSGGTITVSNVGTFGAEYGTPIINPPEVAILAVGVIEPRALVVRGEVTARPAMTLSLSFDHRVLDGAEAGWALADLREHLEDPQLLRALPV